eukprot:CAMPEP_0116870534 /NCGR_PEP_ID=MMETSP0463-20121206/469_1 /TAXON_ID=181622 /ORGANISM="Strombidinopsis sp, Strain SopsisLIS2011" /LENGTH=58 /DNA_ID=CAMNT_0004507221 /DNA_START=696 /DNA_END=873 /DNA_ORIENTATION=+
MASLFEHAAKKSTKDLHAVQMFPNFRDETDFYVPIEDGKEFFLTTAAQPALKDAKKQN